MYLDTLQVLDSDSVDNSWVRRLRRGNFVWLAKEKKFAQVEWAWEHPEPGYISGRNRISLRKRM